MQDPLDHAVSPEFSERLKRIEAQHARVNRKKARIGPGGSFGYLFSLIVALGIGYLVIVLARYARFHLTGLLPGESGVDVSGLGLELTMALMASLVLRMVFDFKSAEHAGAKGVGMVAGLFTMHFWVHAFPEQAAILFSEAWVNRVIWLTDPSTLAVF